MKINVHSFSFVQTSDILSEIVTRTRARIRHV